MIHLTRAGRPMLSLVAGVVWAFSLLLGTGLSAHAQSGSRYPGGGRYGYPAQRGYQVQPGSTTRSQAGSTTRSGSGTQGQAVALSGYCPVCIIDMKQWVRGSSQFRSEYDGDVYYFPSAEIQQTFLADPGKYVPALGGDCTVCLARLGERMPGSVYHAAYHQGRLYLFPGEDQKQVFVANPAEFADVDVAMNGMCAVCKVEMGQDVPGDPQFAAFHKGMRYLFPGEDQLRMFHANPEKYVPPAGGGPQPAAPPAGGVPQSSLPARTDSPASDVAFTSQVVTVKSSN